MLMTEGCVSSATKEENQHHLIVDTFDDLGLQVQHSPGSVEIFISNFPENLSISPPMTF